MDCALSEPFNLNVTEKKVKKMMSRRASPISVLIDTGISRSGMVTVCGSEYIRVSAK